MFLKYLNPKSLVSIRRTITFRLILWYSAFFILSTSLTSCFLPQYGERTGKKHIKNSMNMRRNTKLAA